MWTNTCCSHPRYQEETIPAVVRRADFELGITDLEQTDLHTGSRILYYADGCETFCEHELDHIVFARKQLEHKSNPDEIMDTMYVSLSNFDFFLQDKQITPWFRLLIERGNLHRWWSDLI